MLLQKNLKQANIYIAYMEKYFRDTRNRCETNQFQWAVNSMNDLLDSIKLIKDSIRLHQYRWQQLKDLRMYFLFKAKEEASFKTYVIAAKKLDDILWNLEVQTLPN